MEPPAFGGDTPALSVAPGGTATLLIPLAGTPPFQYEWSRAGASLDSRFTVSEGAGGVRLTVTAAREQDGGIYTLQASNAAGRDTARVRLEVTDETSGDDPPTFVRRLQDLTVKVGTRTRFLVEILSSTDCKVTWYRNERRLLEAERVSLVRDGNFWCCDVACVSVDDAGRWTCAAENRGGRASCAAHLNVLAVNVLGTTHPGLLGVERVSLVRDGNFWCCDVACVSVDDAGRWTCAAENRGGRASCAAHLNVLAVNVLGTTHPGLLGVERVSLVRDGNFWCCDVACVSVDDAGRWTCAAENRGGRASCAAHLNVLVPKAYKRPEFVEELRAILTEQGTVSLECKVVGVPTPVLRWFKVS
ncbi:titin-like [Cydia splendana]|uniref:titin-like n=1 Tax=Cydia splendana TaxID=1100963 RepID=UPI00300D72D7